MLSPLICVVFQVWTKVSSKKHIWWYTFALNFFPSSVKSTYYPKHWLAAESSVWVRVSEGRKKTSFNCLFTMQLLWPWTSSRRFSFQRIFFFSVYFFVTLVCLWLSLTLFLFVIIRMVYMLHPVLLSKVIVIWMTHLLLMNSHIIHHQMKLIFPQTKIPLHVLRSQRSS